MFIFFLFYFTILDNILPPIASAGNNNLLQPVSANNNQQHQQTSSSGDTTTSNSSAAAAHVGSTWSDNLKAGDLKIDLDNLLSSKANKSDKPAPSMNALKVQSPAAVPQFLNQQQQVPLTIQTPTMGNFAAFGAQTTTPGISPGMGGGIGGGSAFFNKTSPNIPSQQSQFANFNQMNNMMQQQQPSTNQQQKGFVGNSNSNNNNNNMPSFDFFQ